MATGTIIQHPSASKLLHPTLATPTAKKDAIDNALRQIDDHLNLLRCAADGAAVAETDDELIEALYFLYRTLRREADKLCALL